ncbi:unnamed protein product [Zymoseptoria tritici ST99CH_3D1]|uniref:Carboxylic ester hydrolase n=2 Tax=Zymoseptoria tritici TaxID=1047171 RepID=A0A1X7S289_ZYMT9|nr:unnamed protein product [Zymoseptoria tritici ST99CH_3D7]SMR57320.1 unnamed protein product [Zymoseptoria tritici ST99CH_1E4]SMR60191.1 unnamed protein product [Zymoseptoria tritici ST99CH_3D1]
MHLVSTAASVLFAASLARASADALPTVDLGYEIHQASVFNETLQTYNFTNIRYAQPPTGNLRFAKPQSPVGRNPIVQNGTQPVVCPQAGPVWNALTYEYAEAYSQGNASLLSYEAGKTLATVTPDVPLNLLKASFPPGMTEDCLFLDVVVPQKIFEGNVSDYSNGGADVVIYIHGGAYSLGDKAVVGATLKPDSFLLRAYEKQSPGFIWVSVNYRLGALGFLAGPTLQASGGVSNAGFYDQRLAIDWVYDNIDKFGGDPEKITLIGESAGGGSIFHQITAQDGQSDAKFKKAIPLYSGFVPQPSRQIQEDRTQEFLHRLGTNSIEGARKASSAAVMEAQLRQIGLAKPGVFAFGPAVDGDLWPELPGELLLASRGKNISVLTSYNKNDGNAFTPPDLTSDTGFAELIRRLEPQLQTSNVNKIVNELYPAAYNGTYPYTTPYERLSRFVRDFGFSCNAYYLGKQPDAPTFVYEWAVPPALHGSDAPSMEYTGNVDAAGAPKWSRELQEYLVNFILHGDPNGDGLPTWPDRRGGAFTNVFNEEKIGAQRVDGFEVEVCEFFQERVYDGSS